MAACRYDIRPRSLEHLWLSHGDDEEEKLDRGKENRNRFTVFTVLELVKKHKKGKLYFFGKKN